MSPCLQTLLRASQKLSKSYQETQELQEEELVSEKYKGKCKYIYRGSSYGLLESGVRGGGGEGIN